ncbi:MAG: methionine--tRNA ligase [Planctomycetota bacterium]|jgi:methionyl-tRNA synthetase
MTRPLLVTAALPYANGQPHFGHMVGAYLPADIFVRYHRMIGSDVAFICGMDDHGVANTLGAENAGVPYREFVNRGYELWNSTFERLQVEFDNFSQTCRPEHYPLAQEFFLRAFRNGHIMRRDVEQLYSPATGRFLADRYVTGQCYFDDCKFENARGDECPKCGRWLDANKLIDPRAKLDPEDRLELRHTWQYELDLAPFADDPQVKPWLDGFRTRAKPNVATFVFDKMIEGEGLESRPITRDMPWGVPVPREDLDGKAIEDVEDKVLYVWFDAPIGYISSTREWSPENWRKYWIRKRGEEGARLVHFIGKDNIAFHCIVFPALLAWQDVDDRDDLLGPGPDESYVLPEDVPANEFFNLEGRKFNKSEGWYLDIAEFLDKYGVDRTRFYLCSAMPETADSDFLWREFKAKTDLLANVVGNFAVRILKFLHNYFDGNVPAAGDHDVSATIEARVNEFADHIENYRFRRALDAFVGLAEDGNKFLDETKPWKLRKTDLAACGAALTAALQFLPPLSVLAAPFVPAMAGRLRAMLNLPDRAPGPLLPAETLPEGHALGEAAVLVEKIPDEQIEAEIEALKGA